MTALDRTTFPLEIIITFRVAQRDDLARLEWFGQYSHFRNLTHRAFREQLRGRRLMLLADFNGFPIGQVFIQFESANPIVADGVTRAYLYSFRVMELFQQQGIGTRLLQAAEAVLAQRGFQYALLSVAKDNLKAFRLYERNGYEIIGQDSGEWHYTDHLGQVHYVVEPCWVLEKALTPPP